MRPASAQPISTHKGSSPPTANQGTECKRYKPQSAQPQRAASKTAWQSLKRRVYHSANAIAPPGRRTEQKAREVQKAVHRLVLAMSAQPPANATTIAQHLACIAQANLVSTGKPGTLSQSMAQALSQLLPSLPLDQLKRLRQLADTVRMQAGQDAALQQDMGTVADQAYAQCLQRMGSDLGDWRFVNEPAAQGDLQRILQAFDEALRAPSGDLATQESHLVQAKGRAVSLLQRYGLVRPGMDEWAQGMVLLKDICALFLAKNEAAPEELLRVFKRMPPGLRAELRAAQGSWLPDRPHEIDGLLDQATQTRLRLLRRDLREACHAAQGQFGAPQATSAGLAEPMIKVGACWKALQEHCNAHGTRIPRASRSAFKAIQQSALALPLHDLSPKKLNNAQLRQLGEGLRGLDAKPGAALVEAAIHQRKREAAKTYDGHLGHALQALQGGHLALALQHLDLADQAFLGVQAVCVELGERVRDNEDSTALVARLMREFFDAQSADSCRLWFDWLNRPATRLSSIALQGIGARSGGGVHQGIRQTGMYLGLLNDVMAEKLGTPVPAQGATEAKAALASMDRQTFEVVNRFTKGLAQQLDTGAQDALAQAI